MTGWLDKLTLIVVAANLATAPSPARAQDEDAEPTIVVTGSRQAQIEAEAALRQTAMALARTVPNDGALPRFIDPLCLAVAGLDAAQGGKLHRLISAHFDALDISDAAEGCSPNVLVIVSSTPQQTIAQLARRQPALFRAEIRRQRASQLERGDPAIVWISNERRSSLGRQLPSSSVIPGMGHTGRDGELSFRTAVNSGTRPSRIGLTGSLAIQNAVIVIDANSARGKTLGQLAAYTSMRVLAFPDAPSPAVDRTMSRPPSILDLFDENAPALPNGLTPFDSAFLSGLYDMPINASPQRLAASVIAAFQEAGAEGGLNTGVEQ